MSVSPAATAVQLWRAANDQNAPNPTNSDIIASELPTRPDVHTVPDAGHFVFLAPCSAALAAAAPAICHDTAGVDRVSMHAEMNAAVTRFFTKWLVKTAPPTP